MPAGQSYLAYKFANFAGRGIAKLLGADESAAENIGKGVGAYVGGWTALITADPGGAALTAADIASGNKGPDIGPS